MVELCRRNIRNTAGRSVLHRRLDDEVALERAHPPRADRIARARSYGRLAALCTGTPCHSPQRSRCRRMEWLARLYPSWGVGVDRLQNDLESRFCGWYASIDYPGPNRACRGRSVSVDTFSGGVSNCRNCAPRHDGRGVPDESSPLARASRDHGQMSWLNCGVLHVCPLQDSGVLIVKLQKSTDSFTVQESKVTV